MKRQKPYVSEKHGQEQQSLSHITEEALDDWIFQSFNRPLMSFLDPKKKFEVAVSTHVKHTLAELSG